MLKSYRWVGGVGGGPWDFIVTQVPLVLTLGFWDLGLGLDNYWYAIMVMVIYGMHICMSHLITLGLFTKNVIKISEVSWKMR